MATPDFDRARVIEVLRRAAEKLSGDWLLVGGAAAAVWFQPDRTTEDLDLVGLPGTTDPRMQLLEFADGEGLPVEALNSAADFFVRRISGWDSGTALLIEGDGARFHLPSPTVFLLTKLARLSEADLHDCFALLEHIRTADLTVEVERVRGAILELPDPESAGQAQRRRRLLAALKQ